MSLFWDVLRFVTAWFLGFVRCPWCGRWWPLWHGKYPGHCKNCGREV